MKQDEQRCENCFFWRNKECHKACPEGWGSGYATWSKTLPDDWCGEWRPQHD